MNLSPIATNAYFRIRSNSMLILYGRMLCCWALGLTVGLNWMAGEGYSQEPPTKGEILIVVGHPGAEEYAAIFREAADKWVAACKDWDSTLIDGTREVMQETHDRDAIFAWIAKPSQSASRWIVMIGHGTANAKAAQFNLRGPDISAEELSKALDSQKMHWVIINCSSSSGPFLTTLSKPNRIVVTATKSGSEQNFAYFGKYFAESISQASSDLDHDDRVSVLEAFLAASNQTAEFYKSQDRLATEHALLDDNGDKQGTPSTFFRGARAIKKAGGDKAVDGRMASRYAISVFGEAKLPTAEEIAQLEALEKEIEALRLKKDQLGEDRYYELLEAVFLRSPL